MNVSRGTVPAFVTYCGRREMLSRSLLALADDPGISSITIIDNTGGTLKADWFDIVVADNTHRHHAPWRLGLVPADSYYIATEEDVEIDMDCPEDLVARLIDLLERYPEYEKVGPSICTDVPDFERHRVAVHHEQEWNKRPGPEPGTIGFPIDTHFALYRPGAVNTGINGIRLAPPYSVRHLTWYNEHPTDDDLEYYSIVGPEWLARGSDTAHLVER